MNDNFIEREAFAAFLLGNYSDVYTKNTVDHYIEHAHVSWLSWQARAAIERQSVPAGYVLVPNSLIDKFPEINPSNYGHDDACALNRWGCEVVTAAIERQSAAPQPQPVQEPVMYQFRWTNPAGQQVNDTAIEWTQVEPRWNGTVQEKCAELLSHRYGESPCYEVRALYTSPQAQPLTVEQIWENDAIMSLNADAGLSLTMLEKIVRIVEASHGITKGTT